MGKEKKDNTYICMYVCMYVCAYNLTTLQALCVNKTELIVLPPDQGLDDMPNSDDGDEEEQQAEKFVPWHSLLRVQTVDTLCSSLSESDVIKEALSDLVTAVYVSDGASGTSMAASLVAELFFDGSCD